MDFQLAERKADDHKVDLMDKKKTAAWKVSKLAELTEIHWAGLMDSQWADLKAVKLVHVMVAKLAKSTAELTEETRVVWKMSKLADLMDDL
jgi:hypothetical protein